MAIDIMGAFETEPPELDFIWPGFLSGTVGALVAPGATGKSFWALEAAMAVAAPGADLLGLRPPASGAVGRHALREIHPAL
jgi:regulatory protein RepA